MAARMRKALEASGFGVKECDKVKALVGPSVVVLRVLLEAGARLAAVQARALDIARELGLAAPPLIRNLPGEPYIGIYLPRERPELAPLLAAITALAAPTPTELFVAIGISPEGRRYVVDVARSPHLLVGGTTGSGKTMTIHVVIVSLLAGRSPSEIEILLVDPKGTDFGLYDALPHVRGGAALTDAFETLEALHSVVEVDLPERTAHLKRAGHASVLDLNAASPPAERLRPLVIVIDEFADLVDALPRAERLQLEHDLGRLLQRGRSAGIFVVLATQRPSVKVLPGNLKANLPCRVALRLPSRTDSQTILDQAGAERLLGAGDMLLLADGQLVRLQGYYASPEELRSWVATQTINTED